MKDQSLDPVVSEIEKRLIGAVIQILPGDISEKLYPMYYGEPIAFLPVSDFNTMADDAFTLLSIVKARQVRGLTDTEIIELRAIASRDSMIVHGPADPFVRISTSEHKAIRTIIDRLTTPTADKEG